MSLKLLKIDNLLMDILKIPVPLYANPQYFGKSVDNVAKIRNVTVLKDKGKFVIEDNSVIIQGKGLDLTMVLQEIEKF